MTHDDVNNEALSALDNWYESFRGKKAEPADRYVVCAGLAVLEVARFSFPLSRDDYVTKKNQVKTSRLVIQRILARYGEQRIYANEGGRTTRGTVPAAEKLAAKLNDLVVLHSLAAEHRGLVIEGLQGWLAERVAECFSRQRIEIELDLSRPGPALIAGILKTAGTKAGPVAQHLVGAKLAMRHEGVGVDNHSYTTADQQLNRPGDFLVGDAVFHVTVAPMPQLLEKCRNNARDGYRAKLLVTEDRIAAARQMADALNIGDQVDIRSIADFVGGNVEELGGYLMQDLRAQFRRLLDTYNARVSAVETDVSLQIEIPQNL